MTPDNLAIYAQLSGVTATTLGVMVVVRQHVLSATGERSAVTRVVDVRLQLRDGAWALDVVASVGGTPARRPARLSAAAARVLDHPRLFLPDSARWDIHRGVVDDRLLLALARAADRRRIAITTLSTGHPSKVWATDRPSARRSTFRLARPG